MAQTLLDLNPSLALIPSAYKAGKLYSLIPADGSGDFDVSRNGTATRVNKNGLIESVAANVPRFEFDPITGEFLGVLVEPAATNLLTRNDDFSDLYWTKTRVDIGSVRVSPTGENNARKLMQDTGFTTSGTIGRLENLSGPKVLSVFVKKEEKNWCYFRTNTAALDNRLTWFNIESGVVGQKSAAHTAYIFPAPLGYYRIMVIDNSPLLNRQLLYLADADGSEIVSGDGGGIVIFGFQVSENISSYIPTSGFQVTRPADIITVTVPAGATEVVYVNNGVQTTLPVTGGSTFQLPVGLISKLWMT